jgi:hypothetical protein
LTTPRNPANFAAVHIEQNNIGLNAHMQFDGVISLTMSKICLAIWSHRP